MGNKWRGHATRGHPQAAKEDTDAEVDGQGLHAVQGRMDDREEQRRDQHSHAVAGH